jgi:O-antigen ligase
MAGTSASTQSEGLKAARLLMVLSSISPLFILWAIRGNSLIPDPWFIGFCALMVIVPNTFLWLRIHTARKQADKRELSVGTADDHRDHILVYLFAMLLPFYSEAIGTWRDFSATLAALVFIVFLFWHLNLHYMNLLFAVRGLRVFTVYPPADGNPLTGKLRQAVITRRVSLSSGDRIIAYRLSDTVYLEDDV